MEYYTLVKRNHGNKNPARRTNYEYQLVMLIYKLSGSMDQ